MPKPGEHKTVQARILEYTEAIGWTLMSREEAEERRGFDPDVPTADRAKNRSLLFDDQLDANLPPPTGYTEAVLLGRFPSKPMLRRTGRHLDNDIYSKWRVIEHFRDREKFFDHEENRERDYLQDLFRTLLHELITAKIRVSGKSFSPGTQPQPEQ